MGERATHRPLEFRFHQPPLCPPGRRVPFSEHLPHSTQISPISQLVLAHALPLSSTRPASDGLLPFVYASHPQCLCPRKACVVVTGEKIALEGLREGAPFPVSSHRVAPEQTHFAIGVVRQGNPSWWSPEMDWKALQPVSFREWSRRVMDVPLLSHIQMQHSEREYALQSKMKNAAAVEKQESTSNAAHEFVDDPSVLKCPTNPARRRQSVQCTVPDSFVSRPYSAMADHIPLTFDLHSSTSQN